MLSGIAEIILNLLSSQVHVFQQTFKGCVGCSKADRQAKISFPTKSIVSKTILQFFSNVSRIRKCENLLLQHIEKK